MSRCWHIFAHAATYAPFQSNVTAFLRLDDVAKSFGAVTVSDGLNFEVTSGEALGIIGPNGASKTSMFNMITGILAPDSQHIFFDYQDITKMSAAKRCRTGMARSFQVPQQLSDMTVFENAMIAATQAASLNKRDAERFGIQLFPLSYKVAPKDKKGE